MTEEARLEAGCSRNVKSQWIEISTLAALADSAYERFEFEDIDVLVFREGSHVYAIEDLCTHDGAELCGTATDGEIECPRHGARFCIKTGQALSAPAYGQVSTLPIRVNDQELSKFNSTQTNGASVT